MNKETILADWEQCTDKLIGVISQFTPETFNQKPSENEWSAAQVAEHLLKVDFSTNKALRGETIPTNRPPEQKIALIKGTMEDSTKRVAPERAQPSGERWEPEALVKQLKKQRELLKEVIQSSDLTEACTSFKHFALGTLTKLEWIYFNIYHAERHMKQLHRLSEKVVA